MPGLTRVKTYANKSLVSYGALTTTRDATLFWMIKESMLYGTNGIKGGGAIAAWEVVGSSNSVNFNIGGPDLLVSPANIINGTGNHSWVVLKQPLQGDGPGFLQVCFDWNSAISYHMSLSFSISAGYTGGSISARPIATDEVVVFSSAQVLDNLNQIGSSGVNCLKSTDGKVTRIVVTRDTVFPTRAFWAFEELIDVEAYWPSKSIVAVCPLTHTGVSGTSNIYNRQGGAHSGRMSWAGVTSYLLSNVSAPTTMHRPDGGGSWPVYPCGMFNDVGASKGKVGNFADLWAVPYPMPTGEYLAADGGGDYQYVNIGGLVFPWVGTPLVLP
jgi:hypothetical protein